MMMAAQPVKRVLCLILAVTSLAACVSAPAPIVGASSATQPSELSQWQARGRIGINAAEQSGSGAFTWVQRAAHSVVELRGPAGFGSMDMELDGTQLRIRSGDGAQYDAGAAMQALQQRLGVSLPVASLRYWLLGLPAPGPSNWLDESHQRLEQHGWRVSYSQWSARRALRLPLRMMLEQENVRIRIVVQAWNLAP